MGKRNGVSTTGAGSRMAAGPREREWQAETARVQREGPTGPLAYSSTAGWLALIDLLGRTDGWLRIVPDGEGKQLYIKWKFTRGTWARHYVMARVEPFQLAYGLALLQDKLTAVDVGVKRPTLDTAYDQ